MSQKIIGYGKSRIDETHYQTKEPASETEKFSAEKLERKPQEEQENQKLKQPPLTPSSRSFLQFPIPKSNSIKLDETPVLYLFFSSYIVLFHFGNGNVLQ